MFQNASSLNPTERFLSLLMAVAIPGMLAGGLLTLHSAANESGGAGDSLVSFALRNSERAQAPKPQVEPQPAREEAGSEQVRVQQADSHPRRPVEALRFAEPEVEIALPVVPLGIAGPPSPPLPAEGLGRSARGGDHPGASDRASESSAARSASGPSASRVGRDGYGQVVYRRIREEQRFEHILRRQGIAGTVVVGFGIDQQGRLRRPRIVQSSGHAVLDRIAMRHLAAASPFPRPPEGEARSFQIPMTYRERG